MRKEVEGGWADTAFEWYKGISAKPSKARVQWVGRLTRFIKSDIVLQSLISSITSTQQGDTIGLAAHLL